MKKGLLALVVSLGWAVSAWGVIKVDMPVSTVYRTASVVIVGKVTQVNAGNRVVDVKVEGVLKGQLAGEQVRVQIAQPEGLIGRVAADQPVVVFVGRRVPGQSVPVTMHIADTWLLAQPIENAQPPAWRSVQEKADQKKSFPGATATLVQIVNELKANGKTTLMDLFEAKIFHGGVKQIAKLPVSKATALAAADVTGDGKVDLVVGTAEGARVFAGGASGFAEAKVDAAKAEAALKANAAAAKAAGLEKDLTANIERLTGEPVDQFRKAHPQGFKEAAATAIDVNGDGRVDYLVLTPAGGVLLVNRGFGAYLIDNDTPKLFKAGGAAALPFAIGPNTPIARADLHGDKWDELLVLGEDGTVYEVGNAP